MTTENIIQREHKNVAASPHSQDTNQLQRQTAWKRMKW